jgi:hypothetical protein
VRLTWNPRISILRGDPTEATNLDIEAWRALFQAEVIFHTGCSNEVTRWLADFARLADIVDLGLGFDRMGPDRPNLHRTTAIQVAIAATLHGEIVLIDPDRSGVTSLVTQFVLRAADIMGVPVRVIPLMPDTNCDIPDSPLLRRPNLRRS